MDTLGEFKSRIKKSRQPKTYRVRNSVGIYDGFKYYRKNKPDNKLFVLTESQYFAITRKVNLLLAEELSKGNDIKLPKLMGTLEVRRIDKTIKIGEDGKVHTNLAIDWDKTLELWYNDPESYAKKTLVRIETDKIFKLYYNRTNATYNNKSYYEFIFNKYLKAKLRHQIRQGKIDAPLLSRNINYGR